MPSSRRLKVTGLAALLTICVVFYITHGASSTQNSDFYKRTVSAIQKKQLVRSREDVLEEERRRFDRLDRIEKEHIAALSAAPPKDTKASSHENEGSAYQNPIIPNGEYGASKVVDAKAGEKSVAGRKYMKDGKVVTYKSREGAEDDGVAKVGNVYPYASHEALPESHSEEAVESALNDILRKGPIIVFSKTYCPHSKKAKHILLDLYAITPPPYVVELDEHKLGTGLQSALERLTGRRTVPNVMINGRSIGGGDDVQQLHEDDQLASTISSMGGKRMTKVQRLTEEIKKQEMKFKV